MAKAHKQLQETREDTCKRSYTKYRATKKILQPSSSEFIHDQVWRVVSSFHHISSPRLSRNTLIGSLETLALVLQFRQISLLSDVFLKNEKGGVAATRFCSLCI